MLSPVATAFWQLDAAPLAALVLAAATLGALGALLVLRREALLGDALAHAVLPGLVVAWLVTGSRGPLAMVLGALVAGLATSALTGLVVRQGRVERSTALGLVFTGLFALGVLAIEQTGARQVDLDVGCVLSGQPELLVWPEVRSAADLLTRAAWRGLPHAVVVLAAAAAAAALLLILARRPIALATFDPRFARTIGLGPGLVSGAVVGLVTLTIVASFEAVGAILVVGLLVLPGATVRIAGGARARGDLGRFLGLSAGLGAGTAVAGYAAAAWVAPALGWGALDTAGTVTTLGGALLGAAAVGRGRA